ncbi:MAG: hypothetical protein QNJ44_20110 [Rhodobacter sp.]|nr:hypothetical protein [Rhodobacter sp.]
MTIQNPPPPPEGHTRPDRPSVHFDWREWLRLIAESDASEEEKRRIIEHVWLILLSFVDLGWEVGDAGAQESCGQVLDPRAALQAAVVQSGQSSEPDDPSRETADDVGTDAAM